MQMKIIPDILHPDFQIEAKLEPQYGNIVSVESGLFIDPETVSFYILILFDLGLDGENAGD